MYKPQFNKRKALVFKQFTHKGWSLFACLGRVVVISVLSASTLENAEAASRHLSTDDEPADTTRTDKEVTLDDIEVSASRAPLALGQAARMVTVLTRTDIQAAPVQSVNDLLKYAAGVDVRQRGPLGAQTDIGIRGGTQEQITILLNGINICDPQTGHNTLELPVSLSDIERIEILEGPAARVYGTSSLMGAINIVTRQDDSLRGRTKKEGGRRLDLQLEGGSFGYLSAGGRFSHLAPRTSQHENPSFLENTISASYTRSDGYSRAKSGALNSDFSGFKAFYQGSYVPSSLLSPPSSLLSPLFSLYWHAGISTKGYGSNTFYSAKYDEQYESVTKTYAALQGDITAGRLHFKPTVSWNRSYDRFELIRGSEQKVPYNYHRSDVFLLSLNSWFDSPLGRTAFGAEVRNEDIISSNLGEPLSSPSGRYVVGLNRTNLSAHLEHNVVTHWLTVSAGFTAVKNTWNQMPFTLYPGIDASVRLTDWLRFYASYNESLRMPSFTELYYSVGGHKADKYLKPEELRAVEGGVKLYSRKLTAKASVFYHHQRNTIDWVLDTRLADEATWQSVNLTKINTTGVEVSVNVQLPTLVLPTSSSLLPPPTLSVSYCYLHQQKDEQPYLQSRYSLEYLRHKLTASLYLPLWRQLDLTLKYRFQDRMGSYTDTEGQVQHYHPYSVADARLAWTAERYTLYVEGNNLLSKRYIDYGNVPQPGFCLVGGLKVAL